MEMGKDIWDVKTDLGSWVKGLLCSLSQGMASSDSYWVKINKMQEMPGFQNSKNGKKHNFLLLEHFQKFESKSGLAGSVFKIG